MRIPFTDIHITRIPKNRRRIFVDASGKLNPKGLPIDIEPVTALHPDFKSKVEYAFTIDGKEYYHFHTILDMPPLRYMKIQDTISDTDMRVSAEELSGDLDLMSELINKGDITKTASMIEGLKYRMNTFMNIDLFYRLFSVAFFTLDEDLTDYDYDIGDDKIKAFKSEPLASFFFRKPIKEYLPQVNLSEKDLDTCLKASKVGNEAMIQLRATAVSWLKSQRESKETKSN